MNFLLSPEQVEMQRAVERYLDASIDTTSLHKLFDAEGQEGGHDEKLWSGLAELGVLAVNLPESDGGLGLEMIDLALVAETIGSRAAPVPFLGHVLAILAIAWAGSAQQKARWLPALVTGEVIGSVGFQYSPAAGGALQWLSGDSVTEAPATSKVSGTWGLVPHATVASLFVLALPGGGLAVVEREAVGLEVSGRASIDRTRRLGTLQLSEVQMALLPDGPRHAQRLRDAALVLLAADAFGGATRCHEMATAYAKERVQFGQPIGQFQAVKHQLADMVLGVEPARGLHWYAAHAFDHSSTQDAAHMAALAKAHIADLYVAAARRCVELHGGMGYTWEMDVHIFLRRAMFDYSWMGQPALHRARAAELAGW